MTRAALVLLLVLAAATAARADAPAPTLALEHLDLLPLGEFERQDFRAAHLDLARRLEAKARAKEPPPPEDLARLRELLRPHGLTDELLAAMAHAPRGEGRVERYSYGLVLLLDDLTPAQRRIFERVIAALEGQVAGARALEDRMKLGLEQAALEERQRKIVLDAFRRQQRLVDARFWQLVDYVLEDDQKARLWEMLPTSIRRHATPQDHVYALPTLRPTQGARVKALVTEVEAESAPDEALVRRLRVALRAKDLDREERQGLAKQMRDAQARLNELRRFAYDAVVDLLDEDQIHQLKAIPPRVSLNDRRRDGRRVLEGLTFQPAQEAALQAIRQEGKVAARAHRERVQAVREEAGEVGPDTPQMMMMEMMMASARGEAQADQRRLLGRVFREVLTLDQVTGWVMGLYGDRR